MFLKRGIFIILNFQSSHVIGQVKNALGNQMACLRSYPGDSLGIQAFPNF